MDTAEVQKVTPADDDARLVRAAAAGDAAAMDQLLIRARAIAYRFSLMVCGRALDTEDVMQDALLSTYRHAADIRDPASFRAWLYRTVRNACLLTRRKRVDEPAHLLPLDAPGSPDGGAPIDAPSAGRTPEEEADAAERQAMLRQALQQLPERQREIIVLRELEGLSTREVAAVLQISEDNVKTRLHRGRRALRAALQ